jgi:hypothetical protein
MKINEKTGLYENYGLWHVPFWQTRPFQVMFMTSLIIVVLLIVFYVIHRYIRYKNSKKRLPWDQALYELEQLDKNHKVSIEGGKEFYSAVSEIIKYYMAARFGYDVVGKTDSELVRYLEEKRMDEDIVLEIKHILHGSEVIKFANAQAIQEKISDDFNRSLALIEKTIPRK